jgi:hypothetical protein
MEVNYPNLSLLSKEEDSRFKNNIDLYDVWADMK